MMLATLGTRGVRHTPRGGGPCEVKPRRRRVHCPRLNITNMELYQRLETSHTDWPIPCTFQVAGTGVVDVVVGAILQTRSVAVRWLCADPFPIWFIRPPSLLC